MIIATAVESPDLIRGQVERPWTKQDLALYFGVTTRTIDSWRTSGRLPKGARFGRGVRWEARAIRRLARIEDAAAL